MPFLFWTLIFGAIGAIGMLFIKSLEINSGKGMVLAKISEKTNHIAHSVKDGIILTLKKVNGRSLFNVIVRVVHLFVVMFEKVEIWIREQVMKNNHSRRLVEAVKGKYNLEKKKEASPFFKNIEPDIDGKL